MDRNEEIRWEEMLQSVKQKGKRIKKQRRAAFLSTLSAVCIVSALFLKFGIEKKPSESALLLAENTAELEMLLSDDAFYDEDLGIITALNQ
jgi:hypothetical protein